LNLASFIAHKVTRKWQKLGINSFLIFKNLTKIDRRNWAKTSLFASYPIFKNQILKNWKDPNRTLAV